MTSQTTVVADGKNDSSTETDLREENLSLQTRLFTMKNDLKKVVKENSILKMKSTMTLGQMRLKSESIREDNQFLIEKCIDLKKKVDISERSLYLKKTDLTRLQSTMQDV